MVFEPDFLKVEPGDTVKFVLVDKNHNAEAIKEVWPEGVEPLKGEMNSDAEFVVEKPGIYGIKCHPALHHGHGGADRRRRARPTWISLRRSRRAGRRQEAVGRTRRPGASTDASQSVQTGSLDGTRSSVCTVPAASRGRLLLSTSPS